MVGCGLRGLGLLTATPALFGFDLAVVDAGSELGVGAFRDYDIESNSNGSDFFGWIDPAGPFAGLLTEGPIERLRSTNTGFRLALLADALACAGRSIRAMLPPGRVFQRDVVVEIELPIHGSDESGPVHVRTLSGRTLQAQTVVLATGIRERPGNELAALGDKVVSSRRLLRPDARERCVALGESTKPVCIVGASHSAFSVLARMVGRPGASPAAGDITLVSRSPVKVYYESWGEYARTPHTAAEATPVLGRDVCPETGTVHRYSGLRNTAKALFHAVAAGQVPGVRIVVSRNTADHMRRLEAADTVIQATGYGSNLPRLTRGGRPVECLHTRGSVRLDGRGRLCTVNGVHPSLFVMGMDPYPYDDNSVNPTSQYARRGGHLLDHLTARGTGIDRPMLPALTKDSY